MLTCAAERESAELALLLMRTALQCGGASACKTRSGEQGEKYMRENILGRTTELARVICEKYADKEAVAIDATCGNGNDTVWLAERFGKVYAFDIQEKAVKATREKAVSRDLDNVTVFCTGHQHMAENVHEKAALIIFNLGYLPGGDKNIVTGTQTTLEAVRAALSLLKRDGLLCITMYPGHPQGAEEKEALMRLAAGLDKGIYHCVRTDMVNQPDNAPEILFITLKKGD